MNRSIRSSAMAGKSFGSKWPAHTKTLCCVGIVGVIHGDCTICINRHLPGTISIHAKRRAFVKGNKRGLQTPLFRQHYIYYSCNVDESLVPELRTMRKLNISSIDRYSPIQRQVYLMKMQLRVRRSILTIYVLKLLLHTCDVVAELPKGPLRHEPRPEYQETLNLMSNTVAAYNRIRKAHLKHV